MDNRPRCLLCGSYDVEKDINDGLRAFIDCKTSCGRYEIGLNSLQKLNNDNKDKIASYLYYNNHNHKHLQTFAEIDDQEYVDVLNKLPEYHCYNVTFEQIDAFCNKTFSEKIDNALLSFAEKSKSYGSSIKILNEELASAYFIKRYKDSADIDYSFIREQIKYINNYLSDNNYIKINQDCFEYKEITLLPNGWKRIDELQKSMSNNKNVFVSMAFNDSTNDTREAIRQGIINAGYSAEFIDEIIHNKQIVPEMFRLIRESRFLILDISDPNYGAYYEAGYALGLGKEVIICCNQDVFSGNVKINGSAPTDEENEKFGKYLRPHFDIAQKQILVWNDYDDLTKKLEEWIKAII